MFKRALSVSAAALLLAPLVTSAAPPAKQGPAFKTKPPELAAEGESDSPVPEKAGLQDPGAEVSAEAQKLARRAMVSFVKGDLKAAERGFRRVLEVAPGNVPTMINLGLIAYRQQRFTDAEKVLKEILQKQPEAGPAWFILGVVYYDQDKLDEALAALAQAVLLEPKDARTHHYLGVTIGKKGWLLGAEDEMRKALELDPDYAEAHFNLAVFYLQRNPPAVELARRHYQKALDLGAAPDAAVARSIGVPAE